MNQTCKALNHETESNIVPQNATPLNFTWSYTVLYYRISIPTQCQV